MKILLIPPKEVHLLWNEVAPIIDKGLRGPDGTVAEDFLEPLKKGSNILWIIVDGFDIESVVVGQFVDYPRKKALSIEVWATKSGHKFDEVYPLIESIKKFAKANGCEYIEATVRKGLARKLKWNDKHSFVTLTL